MEVCIDCKKEVAHYYRLTVDDECICTSCSGDRTRKEMIETGKAILYLLPDSIVSDGLTDSTLTFKARIFEGGHNWWHVKQYYAYFWGPDGKKWYGRCVSGGRNETLRCKRIKQAHWFAESWYAKNRPIVLTIT